VLAWVVACATPVEPPPARAVAPAERPVVGGGKAPRTPAEAGSAPAAPVKPAPPEPLQLELPAIDALLNDAIAAGKLPGAVIAVGRSSGIVWQRAYGSRALVPAREPMTLETVFDLASLSKSVATATAAMWMVEQGKLALDAKVASYLPEIPQSARFVTVRQLLLHTSGLPGVVPLQELAGGPERARKRLLQTEPQHMPGTRYQYSDIGFIWLGIVLERASGEPLDALVERVMLDPLAMTDSRYVTSSSHKPDAGWLARIAPTELTEARPVALIRGEVHDPLAYRIGGAAGNAGLFSTARDLSRFARMLLGRGALLEPHGRTVVLDEATAVALTEPRRVAGFTRTYGWDVHSPHSRNRGALLSPRAFGHGGFTGTALWIDPEQDLFVVFLSNRVHPNGSGNVIELTARVTDAAVSGVARAAACPLPEEPVLPGVDVLQRERFARIAGKRVGLLTHRAARAAGGMETLEVFARASETTLAAVLTPEHGLDAKAEGVIESATHSAGAAVRVPVYSLFGKRKAAAPPPGAEPPAPIEPPYSAGRRPTQEMLRGLDVIVIDLVDVGTRFFTYASTVRETLIAANEARLPVLLLDRPNPIGGARIEGPMLDPGIRSFVNHYALPIRHGMTLGELAVLMARELGLRVQLEVVRVAGYQRDDLWSDTQLAWLPPSPNLTSETAALLYPAVGVLEGTNVSVGRGTDAPFAQVGAPFIDRERMAATLNAAAVPGVVFRPTTFTPSAGPHRGAACHGVAVGVSDPRAYSSALTALALIRALLAEPGWDHEQLMRLLGHRRTWSALKRNIKLEAIVATWQPELDAFAARRQRALLYPLCRAAM
jgi:uncharacterized protein YbbC (DUF1343 family)